MARVRELAGLPIEQHNSPNRGGQMSGHRGVVLHIAQGTYRGTISWQMNPDQRYSDGTPVNTCSTWIVGRQRGEWAQMVDSDEIAWAHRGGSRTWLSIELAGFAPAAPTDWQIEACAQLLAWSARTDGHPIARADHEGQRGLGHHSMDREQFGIEWGHEQCPGSGVIAAKDRIVARARQIAEGEDDMDQLDIVRHTDKNVAYHLRNTLRDTERANERLARLLAGQAASREREEAILAAVGGEGREQILARIQAHHDEQMGAISEQQAALVRAEQEREALAELVRQGQSGELEAAEVVRLIGEKLTAAAEPAGDES